MKLEKLVGERFKEKPSDCVIDSHALMLRGGYMKGVAGGIYSQYVPLRRISKKIEQIIREEMDAIDGQEVLFPVVMPGSLLEESGRYTSIGSELMRMTDRNDTPLVLGMTHEEAAVHLVREYANSYQRYPFMIYQVQTKFRDEARPRAGLIRVREFTMKDGYSFHTSQEDLEAYYDRCFHAYNRIFARAGLPDVITVASDNGMMGGNLSHEYMMLTPVGEDSLVLCSHCDYRANLEVAACLVANTAGEIAPLTQVPTPNKQTIEEVCAYLKLAPTQTCKCVVYQKNATDDYVLVFLRGDMDVNETKLTNFLGEEVHAGILTDTCGLVAGYLGPQGMDASKYTLLFDRSLEGIEALCAGANIPDTHVTGLNLARDVGAVTYGDFAKAIEGGICPQCGKHSLTLSRGIEVGNIFQLGTKYTQSMGMQYLDSEGNAQYPVMGCYGIGVGRLAASACEARHDAYGPIWPISIAPWQVHLCCVRSDDAAARACADTLYDTLQAQGVEVIYDDRNVRPGVMFSDADLLGVPVRVIVSPRNLEEGVCEIATRDKSVSLKAPVAEAQGAIVDLIAKLKQDLAAQVK